MSIIKVKGKKVMSSFWLTIATDGVFVPLCRAEERFLLATGLKLAVLSTTCMKAFVVFSVIDHIFHVKW